MKRKANVLGIERAAGMFSRFAKWSSSAMGHPWAFTTAVLIILAWALRNDLSTDFPSLR